MKYIILSGLTLVSCSVVCMNPREELVNTLLSEHSPRCELGKTALNMLLAENINSEKAYILNDDQLRENRLRDEIQRKKNESARAHMESRRFAENGHSLASEAYAEQARKHLDKALSLGTELANMPSPRSVSTPRS